MTENSRSPVLEWVNHAGFIIEHGEVCLIADPWIAESAFDDGWDLISPSSFGYQDFSRVTHIWFSHEHPDHFNPRVIKSIPVEYRKQITVLFQKTSDRRVAQFCQKSDFKVIEMDNLAEMRIGPEFYLTTGKNGELDSWFFARVGHKTILNLNDCIFLDPRELDEVKKITGEPDLLLSVFSYAEKVGNSDQPELRKAEAHRLLEGLKTQLRHFNPAFTFPCAAFKYFSHVENSYLNDNSNTIEDAISAVRETGISHPVVLYPGDKWWFETVDFDEAVEKYRHDWANKEKRLHQTQATIDIEELERTAAELSSTFRRKNNRLLLSIMYFLPPPFSIGRLRINIDDLDKGAELSILSGLQFVPKFEAPDITMTSPAFRTMICTDYGFSTLLNNGRFQCSTGGLSKVYNLAHIGLINRNNQKLDTWYVLANILRVVRTLFVRSRYA